MTRFFDSITSREISSPSRWTCALGLCSEHKSVHYLCSTQYSLGRSSPWVISRQIDVSPPALPPIWRYVRETCQTMGPWPPQWPRPPGSWPGPGHQTLLLPTSLTVLEACAGLRLRATTRLAAPQPCLLPAREAEFTATIDCYFPFITVRKITFTSLLTFEPRISLAFNNSCADSAIMQ